MQSMRVANGNRLNRRLTVIAVTLLAFLTSMTIALPQSSSTTYVVDAGSSRFTVEVGRAGLLKVFGHDHSILVERFAGVIDWNEEDPTESRFTMEVEAASLRVADEELSDKDRATVQSDMETKALGLPDHEMIRFESTSVKVTKSQPVSLEARGLLELRGIQKEIRVPITLAFQDSSLMASGEFEINGKDFGVPQITAVGGAVKTKHELKFAFEMKANADADP